MDGAGEGHIESFLRRSGRDVEDRYVPGFGLAGELRLRVGCGDDRGDGFAGGNPEDLGTADAPDMSSSGRASPGRFPRTSLSAVCAGALSQMTVGGPGCFPCSCSREDRGPVH